MNPNIKELFKASGGYWYRSEDGTLFASLEGAALDKFIELLVRECASISDSSFHEGSAGYLAIKNHFGVE